MSVRPVQDGTLILYPKIGCSGSINTWKTVVGVNGLAWSGKVIVCWGGGGSHTDRCELSCEDVQKDETGIHKTDDAGEGWHRVPPYLTAAPSDTET